MLCFSAFPQVSESSVHAVQSVAEDLIDGKPHLAHGPSGHPEGPQFAHWRIDAMKHHVKILVEYNKNMRTCYV